MVYKHIAVKILLGTFLLLLACKKSKKCHWDSLPSSFVFLLKKNDTRLSDVELGAVKISYIIEGSKKTISDLARGTNEAVVNAYDLGVLATRAIGVISADNNVKIFTITYNSLEEDTIFIDYEPPVPSNGCVYVLKQVKFNNIEVKPDPAYTFHSIYVFKQT